MNIGRREIHERASNSSEFANSFDLAIGSSERNRCAIEERREGRKREGEKLKEGNRREQKEKKRGEKGGE